MRGKLIAIFVLVVILPLGLLAWMGARVAEGERETLQHRFREMLRDRLRATDAVLARLLDERALGLRRATADLALDADSLRRFVRREQLITQALVQGADGRVLHPPVRGPMSRSEAEFMLRVRRIIEDRLLLPRVSDEPGGAPALLDHGWLAYHWQDGVNLIFRRSMPGGAVLGLELNRARLMADVIVALPKGDAVDPGVRAGRVVLVRADNRPLHQWGAFEPPEGRSPDASLAVSEPLGSWRLDCYVPAEELAASGAGGRLNLLFGLVAVGLILVCLAAYLYRAYARDLREAAQRISFVNQVSHELKTPLTNIRMYAELLEKDLTEDDEKTRRHLGVIVDESRRLSRLIGNVLSFARRQRKTLALKPAPGVVDEVIASTLEQFKPPMAERGIEVRFTRGAPGPVLLDADAVEQVLGNLFSNVEKYGAAGGVMEVESRRNGEHTTVTVADRGPGVPAREREAIFRPFYRMSDRVTDGAIGTGMGLAIARDLARLHGGELRLVPSEAGACFRLELHTPRPNGART